MSTIEAEQFRNEQRDHRAKLRGLVDSNEPYTPEQLRKRVTPHLSSLLMRDAQACVPELTSWYTAEID